jgi:hypothetical protein
MKVHPYILTAALFMLAACDGEKVKEAEKKTGEAAVAVGEAAKEVGGKVADSAQVGVKTAGQKVKEVAGAAKEILQTKGGPALESFKAKVGGVSEWFKKSKGQNGEDPDPAKAQAAMTELMTKLKGISAEGLPEDLRSSFQRYQGAMDRVQAITAAIPKQKAAAEAWYVQNADKLQALEKDIVAAAKSFKEAAARHGLTGLQLGTETE